MSTLLKQMLLIGKHKVSSNQELAIFRSHLREMQNAKTLDDLSKPLMSAAASILTLWASKKITFLESQALDSELSIATDQAILKIRGGA